MRTQKMKIFDCLPVRELEVPDSFIYYKSAVEYGKPRGLDCFGPMIKSLEPIYFPIFKIPLDGTIMSVDQWITRDNLEIPFLSVDRSIDYVRLAGTVFKVNSLSYNADSLFKFVWRNGGDPNVFFTENNTGYCIQLNTWFWITKQGKRVALVCTAPGFNGKMESLKNE